MTNSNFEHTSALKALRSLMPNRVLSYGEALQRAELQANRLLEMHHITRAPMPVEIVTELPRIVIRRRYDLPVSGSAHWDGSNWVITLNAGEPDMRQRFSLLHEFKHILDHPVRHLVRGTRDLSADDVAEKVADYFAACVLMPKAWIKAAFCSTTQKTQRLAEMFQVSPTAMSVRLSQLGLTEPTDRCQPWTSVQRFEKRRSTYLRAASPVPVLTSGVSP